MEKQNESMRERLLARLPQPENLAAYREETASLLAKHDKALFWEKMVSTVCYVCLCAFVIVQVFSGQKFDATTAQSIWFFAGFVLFIATINDLRYLIYRGRVDMLKEVKQVQLQVLELQASLQKKDGQ